MSDGILVVDDDADIRESISDVLVMRGFKVQAAVNGQEALILLRKGLRPCLILLDLMMPILNGWEFRAEQTRDPELSKLPVVIISGDGTTSRKAETMGISEYLRKPLELSVMLDVVKRHCPPEK